MGTRATKICSGCKKEKLLNEFKQYTSGNRKGKYYAKCKNCYILYSREYENRKYVKQRRRKRNKTTKRRNYQRDYMLKRKYGISLDEYNKILKEQNGVCAICGQQERAMSKHGVLNTLAVDHDHETGKVRGLLCYSCNVKLGYLENIDFMLKAKLYLAKNND